MTKTRYSKSEDIQARILDAAEDLFAKQGYEATSTRQITAQADVRNASINYYFATKRELAVAVVDRRFDVLQKARSAALNDVDIGAANPNALSGIVSAFVVPLAELTKTHPPGWQNYNRIMAQVAASGEWLQEDYVHKINKTAEQFVNALATAFPTATPASARRAYTYMLGSVLFAFSQAGKTLDQTSSPPKQADHGKDPEALIAFLTAGLTAILDHDP